MRWPMPIRKKAHYRPNAGSPRGGSSMRFVPIFALAVSLAAVVTAGAADPPPAAAQSPVTAPKGIPMPSSPCAASAAMTAATMAEDWECPTCGRRGPCSRCRFRERPALTRLFRWMFYRPTDAACRECPRCASPCHPPLYAWFPCAAGCGGCGGCNGAMMHEGRCGVGGCARPDRVSRFPLCKSRCPKGQCGAFRFIGICKPKWPLGLGGCDADTCAAGDGAMVIPPPPAGTTTPPAATGQESTSYKLSSDGAMPVVRPMESPRATTYRPNAIPATMPVLSPDAFRRPQK